MTERVVTAPRTATIGEVSELMRDRNVGSVVLCDDDARPCAIITDRDVAIAVADRATRDDGADPFGSHPLVTGEAAMDLEEGAALMVQHRIRRLPILGSDGLSGIVTLDDLAVRVGDPAIAQQMTEAVARAALPEFYFHQRGG